MLKFYFTNKFWFEMSDCYLVAFSIDYYSFSEIIYEILVQSNLSIADMLYSGHLLIHNLLAPSEKLNPNLHLYTGHHIFLVEK